MVRGARNAVFFICFSAGSISAVCLWLYKKKVSEKSVVKLSSLTLPIPAVCFGLALILQTDYSKLLLKTGQTTLSPEKVSFLTRWLLGDEYMLPVAYHSFLTALSYIVFVGTLIVLVSKSIEWLYEAKNALR